MIYLYFQVPYQYFYFSPKKTKNLMASNAGTGRREFNADVESNKYGANILHF